MLELDTLKNQSLGELVKLAQKLQDELTNAKFQHATQQYKTPHKLRQMRRDIARVKTLTTLKRKGALVVAKKAPKATAAPQAKKAQKAVKTVDTSAKATKKKSTKEGK